MARPVPTFSKLEPNPLRSVWSDAAAISVLPLGREVLVCRPHSLQRTWHGAVAWLPLNRRPFKLKVVVGRGRSGSVESVNTQGEANDNIVGASRTCPGHWD